MSDNKPHKEMGERIKSARIARGYGHDELRDALASVTPGKKKPALSTLSKWENGKAAPLRYMGRLAHVLGVTAEWLEYGDKGAPSSAESDDVAKALELLRSQGYDVSKRDEPVRVRRVAPEGSGVRELAPPTRRRKRG